MIVKCVLGCDLLSFYYLCRTGNNSIIQLNIRLMLWFAFILLSLSYWKQRPTLCVNSSSGCDLLSFYYLCRTGNNGNGRRHAARVVVICFHFTIFVVLETTSSATTRGTFLLWFAFILLSLSYWKQLLSGRRRFIWRCDLLSFYYLCRTGNNYGHLLLFLQWVVICFHFTIFVVLETTVAETGDGYFELWFAFILLSLSYWKQRTDMADTHSTCCDLLSFYYLCRTGNN